MTRALDSNSWHALCIEVVTAMRAHVLPFATPISRVISDDYGKLEGTGSYLEYGGGRYLVTNEHVARAFQTNRLAHLFFDNPDYHLLTNDFITISRPTDVGVARIDDAVWLRGRHSAIAIPLSRFALHRSPISRELLFMLGLPVRDLVLAFKHW